MAVGVLETSPLAIEPEFVPPPVERASLGEDRTYRFSLAQVDRMLAAGVLPDSAPLELLDGVLVRKMTRNDPHIFTTEALIDAFRELVPAGWRVKQEFPIVLPDGPSGQASLPEPDVTLARGVLRDYQHRKPHPPDIGLVVEVADSSLDEDRRKITRYAWSGIASAWVVNLAQRTVEVSIDPSGPVASPRYQTLRIYGDGDSILVTLDGVEVGQVAVASILP